MSLFRREGKEDGLTIGFFGRLGQIFLCLGVLFYTFTRLKFSFWVPCPSRVWFTVFLLAVCGCSSIVSTVLIDRLYNSVRGIFTKLSNFVYFFFRVVSLLSESFLCLHVSLFTLEF